MKKIGAVLFSLILFSFCFAYSPYAGIMQPETSAGLMAKSSALESIDPGMLVPGSANIDPGMLILRDTNVDPKMLITSDRNPAVSEDVP